MKGLEAGMTFTDIEVGLRTSFPDFTSDLQLVIIYFNFVTRW